MTIDQRTMGVPYEKFDTEVWKYELNQIAGPTNLMVPYGGEILHVGTQDDQIMVWVEVVPGGRKVERRFQVVGTGDTIGKQESYNYIGTVNVGSLVWHVFEDTPEEWR